MIDVQLWDALQARGVTEEHLRCLLRFLSVQHNGSWQWHYKDGRLLQCDARLTFPAKASEIERVCDTILPFEMVGHSL